MLILLKLKKTFKKKHSRPYFLLNNISLVKNTVMQMKMKFLLKIFNITCILFKKKEIETTYVFTHLPITRFIHRGEKQ